jgi:hypothetical protein
MRRARRLARPLAHLFEPLLPCKHWAWLDDPGPEDGGFRLDRFRDGVTLAHIAWHNRDGNHHERQTQKRLKARALLDWIAQHPRVTLVSFTTA